jgi:hypothetical protein
MRRMENNDHQISEGERTQVEKLCGELGMPRAAERLGLTSGSLLRVIAKQPIRRGTAALLKQALQRGVQ